MESLYREILATDAKVMAAMFAILGTVIAAVLSSGGYLYRVQIERKKSLRKVLYLLLEIRHAVISRLFDPDAATEEYIAEMTKCLAARGFISDDNETPLALRQLVKGYLTNIVSGLCSELDERLLMPFEEALLEMSTVAPALAFQLRGREKLESVIGHTDRYLSELSSKLEVDMPESLLKPMLRASSGLKAEVSDDIYEILNKDVMLLANACGWRDGRECRKIIAKGPTPGRHLDLSELDQLIDHFISLLPKEVAAAGVKLMSSTMESSQQGNTGS